MKKLLKSRLFFFVLGAIIFSSATTVALSIIASDVAYDNTNSGSEATTMQGAIDDLYDKANAIKPEPTLKVVKLGSVTSGASAVTFNVKSKLPNIYNKLTVNNIWSRAGLYVNRTSGSGHDRAWGGGISYNPETGIVTISTDWKGDTQCQYGVTHTLYAVYLSSLEDEE